MAAEAAILLKDVQGEKSHGKIAGLWKSSSKTVCRGELILLLPRVKVIPRKDGKPAHNYQLASDSSVTLFCPEEDLAPMSDYEYHLMVAVKSREARYDVFQKDILDWGSKLKMETVVYVALPSKALLPNQRALAIIRYIGHLPGENGVQFGVEIMVSILLPVSGIFDYCCHLFTSTSRMVNLDSMAAVMVSLVASNSSHVMRTLLCLCHSTDSHPWKIGSKSPHRR